MRRLDRALCLLVSLTIYGCPKWTPAASDAGSPPDAAPDGSTAITDAGAPHDAAPSASSGKRRGPPPPPHPKLDGLGPGAKCNLDAGMTGGCAYGSECVDGKCVCTNGWTICNGACRDTDRDFYNCGKCGHVCRRDEYCRYGGTCESGW